LIVARTELPWRRFVRVLSVLPMITPPFVVGLALIMLFGRAGAVNAVLEHAFGIVPTRWIYGLPGVWLAQTLALTPVACPVIVGVQQDPGRAATLAIVLLALSLTLFVIQRRLLARRGFVTISGRSENANRLPLPRAVTAVALGLALPWAALAVIVYAMIFAGG